MKLATLAALAAILLAIVPQAIASDAHLEGLKLDAVDAMYRPAQGEQIIWTDPAESDVRENGVRDVSE